MLPARAPCAFTAVEAFVFDRAADAELTWPRAVWIAWLSRRSVLERVFLAWVSADFAVAFAAGSTAVLYPS